MLLLITFFLSFFDIRVLQMVLRRNGPRNGYRKARKGSPLVNTFRQRCDALELICIIIESTTRIVIDFSTLRVKDDAQFLSLINENVLFQKYPKYYTTSTTRSKNEKNGDNDVDDNEPKRITWSNHRRRNDNDGSITAPIDWIAVQTRPIWDVPKRILTIDCCDDDAKSVALDILKLQDTDFRYIDIDTINNNSDDNEEVEEDNNDSGEDDKLSSIIDFDDI